MSDIGSIEPPKLESDDRAGQFGPTLTVWNRWQPACDTCGRLESSLTGHGKDKKKQQQSLLSCSGCLLSKYCSKECQKQDWIGGHNNRCHLFEADRKLSTVFAKSLGPGTINDPTFDLVDKVVQWNFLNLANHALIASAAVKNDSNLAKSVGVAIFLKLVAERSPSKYDHRSFIIEKVVLVPREKMEKYAEDEKWVKGNFEHDVGEHIVARIIKLLSGSIGRDNTRSGRQTDAARRLEENPNQSSIGPPQHGQAIRAYRARPATIAPDIA